MHRIFSFNSSCLGKKEVLLPDFLILSALSLETSFLCKALGKKVNSFPFLSAWDLWTLQTGQSLDAILDISKSAKLKSKYCLTTEKEKMASIPLQMHETLWLPCSLAPACRLFTFSGRRFSATWKSKSCDFMINKHLTKKKKMFQEMMSKKRPYSSPSYPSFAPLVSSFLSVLLPILIVSLSFSLSSPKLYWLKFFLIHARVFFVVSHVTPTPP